MGMGDMKAPFLIGTIQKLLYSHLHHHSASQRHNIKDRRMNKRRWKEDARRLLYKYIPFSSLQGFERVVQGLHVRGCWMTEHKLHILTPLL